MFGEIPEYSPDLEWMLQSGQISDRALLSALDQEYGHALRQLVFSLLDDRELASKAMHRLYRAVLAQRHRFSAGDNPKIWLYTLALQICQHQRTPNRLLHWVNKPFHQGESVSPDLDARRQSETDLEIWRAFDRLSGVQRVALLLRYLHGLSIQETARILRIRPEKVLFRLHQARWSLHRRLRQRLCALASCDSSVNIAPLGLSHLHARGLIQTARDATLAETEQASMEKHLANCDRCRAYAFELERLEDLLSPALAARWNTSLPVLIDPLVEDSPVPVENPSRRPFEEHHPSRGIKEALLSGIAVLVVALLMWIANPESIIPPSLKTEFVTRIVRQTELVTVHITATPRPTFSGPRPTPITPVPTAQPLTDHSSAEEIRLRMLESSNLWNTLWAEAIIIDYGPLGYVGLPRRYYNQAFISQPGRLLILGGPEQSEPDYMLMESGGTPYEVDLRSGLSYYLEKGGMNQPAWFHPFDQPAAAQNWPRQPLYGFYLYDLLSPSDFAARLQDFEVHGTDLAYGRTSLVLDLFKDEALSDRMWVDTSHGILHIWRKYHPSVPSLLLQDIILTGVAFDIPLSPSIFVPNQWQELEFGDPWPAPRPYVLDVPAWIEATTGRPPYRPNPEEGPLPPGFNPALSEIVFQWSAPPAPYSTSITEAHLFADGYYLAKIPAGDPWQMRCERSSNGRYLAYTDPTLQALGLRWIDLHAPTTVHQSLPADSLVSISFTFSPDNTRLAFWGCGGKEDNCGIYIQNLTTGKNLKLAAVSNVSSLAWSPDSEQLAAVVAFYSTVTGGYTDMRLWVLESATGVRLYEGPYDQLRQSIAPDAPVTAWGISFPPSYTGLEGCALPPGSALPLADP